WKVRRRDSLSTGLVLLPRDLEFDAAVPAPGGFVVALHGGGGFAEADRDHARGRRAEVDQVLLRCVRAALAEREVVLLAAALVGVTFERDRLPLRVAADRLAVGLQRGARVAADLGAVVVEVDRAELAHALRLGAERVRVGRVGPVGELTVAGAAGEIVLVGVLL